MLIALILCVVFGFLCYGLWRLWRRHAPALVPPGVPQSIRQPSFFLFLCLTLILALLYQRGSRK